MAMRIPNELEQKCLEMGATLGPQANLCDHLPTMDAKPKRRHKYGAVRTEANGIMFASKKEANRYLELKLGEKLGLISDLELQPRYEIVINGIRIGKFTADFRFKRDGQVIIEDVKSEITRKGEAYRLRKKVVEALFGIRIVET